MKENAVLELHNIYKIFPGVKALQDLDFTLREGEIHALMGENGAGKSTLIKVITGVYEKEEGKIFLKGNDSMINMIIFWICFIFFTFFAYKFFTIFTKNIFIIFFMIKASIRIFFTFIIWYFRLRY